MSLPWAVRLARLEATAAAALRTEPGVLVHEAADALWLKGAALDDRLDLRLRAIPGAERFAVLEDGALVPPGRRLPVASLPQGAWFPLREWLSVTFPVAALPGKSKPIVALRLVRSETEKSANLLVTSFTTWRAYAEKAPLVRLQRLTFAASEDGRAVVRGHPLPPLPGERFVEDAGVAVPAGWTWAPPVEAGIVADVLQLQEHDVALLLADGTWELIPATEFVAASRSAIRQTAVEEAR